ncbi:MAG: hypothetical protein ABIO04_08045, partial [Ferruginibacter sp.]
FGNLRVRFIGHAITGRNCWSGDQHWRDIIVGRRPTMAAVTNKGGNSLLVRRLTKAGWLISTYWEMFFGNLRVRFIGHAITGRNCWSGDQHWPNIIIGRATNIGGILLLVGDQQWQREPTKAGIHCWSGDQQRREWLISTYCKRFFRKLEGSFYRARNNRKELLVRRPTLAKYYYWSATNIGGILLLVGDQQWQR